MSEQPKRNIDERIDALTMNMELLQLASQAADRRIEALTALVATHEQEWSRFRRVMRAAFREWMNGDNGNGPEEGGTE